MGRAVIGILIFSVLIAAAAAFAFSRNAAWEGEISLWADVVSKSPGEAGPRNNLGRGYFNAGRFDEALAFLRRARTRDDVGEDWVLRLWYVTADVLERAGRVEEAVREFRKILRHDAGAFDVAERLAQLG